MTITKPDAKDAEELMLAFQAIYESLGVIYEEFQPYFKLIGLFVLGYVAYKMGDYSVSEPIAKKVNNVRLQIEKKEKQKDTVPGKITDLATKITRFSLFFVLLLIVMTVLVFLKTVTFPLTAWIGTLGTGVIIIGFLAIQKMYYTGKLKSFADKQRKIRDDVKKVANMLGSKVQGHIKTTLCKEKILNHAKAPSHVCVKRPCKQLRKLLQTRYLGIKDLAEVALTFQWCSICKKRQPFDELLSFQIKALIQNPDQKQQQEVQKKLEYLLQSFEQMIRWIKQVNPCNCSKLYMEEVLKQKKAYSQIERQTSQKIKELEKRESQAAGAQKMKE